MAASLKYTINISLSIFLGNSQNIQFTYQNIIILSTRVMEFVVDCLTNWRERTSARNFSCYIMFKVGQKKQGPTNILIREMK